MKQGGYRRSSSGFTIVETMIVLAVTGLLFVSAVILINGRQNRTQFMTAINSMQQQLQQIINQASSGFPGDTNYKCTGNSGGGRPTIVDGTGSTNCIFLGKVIQFGTGSGDNASQIVVYPIVANQQAETLNDASPVAVAPDLSGTISTVDKTTIYTLENGINVTAGAKTTAGAVGILSSLGAYASSCEGLCAGSQQFSLYSIVGATANMAVSDVISKIDALNGTGFATADNGVTVCVASGSTNQSGLFTIGGGGGLAVTLQIRSGTTC